MNDCPNCEYHRQRTQRWREEAYRQAGHPLPEREWVGLTDKEILADDVLRYHFGLNGGAGPVSKSGRKIVDALEAKLKERNT